VVDIAMPLLNGIEAAMMVKAVLRDVGIIYLTANSDPRIALHAFDQGALGFLPKTCAALELCVAVRTVLERRIYISPILKSAVGELRCEGIQPMPEAEHLTSRQREVLQLLADGKNMIQVGEILEITPRTVAYHKYRIMEVLGATTNADLVKYAIRNGMIPLSKVNTKTTKSAPKRVASAQLAG